MRSLLVPAVAAALVAACPTGAAATNLNDLLGSRKAPATGGIGVDPAEATSPAAAPAPAVAPAAPAGPGASRRLSKAELRATVRSATVFVVNLVHRPKGDGLAVAATGSGFFIDERTVLTNSHVVAGAEVVWIATGNRYVPAEVVSDSHVGKNRRADFALLRTAEPVAGATLAIGQPVDVLSEVHAVGFPGVVLSRDQRGRDFFQGDLSAVPEVVVSTGDVQNVMENDAGLVMVTHSALIGHGNSGGPLINACGDVVGVNTEVSLEEAPLAIGDHQLKNEQGEAAVAMVTAGFGFAQSVEEIGRFLKSRHQSFRTAEACPD